MLMDTPQRIVGQKLLDLANIEAGVLEGERHVSR
jgi:hypothetical protein